MHGQKLSITICMEFCLKHYVWKFLKYSDRKKIKKSSKTKPYTYELYLRVRIGNDVRTGENVQYRTGTTFERGTSLALEQPSIVGHSSRTRCFR